MIWSKHVYIKFKCNNGNAAIIFIIICSVRLWRSLFGVWLFLFKSYWVYKSYWVLIVRLAVDVRGHLSARRTSSACRTMFANLGGHQHNWRTPVRRTFIEHFCKSSWQSFLAFSPPDRSGVRRCPPMFAADNNAREASTADFDLADTGGSPQESNIVRGAQVSAGTNAEYLLSASSLTIFHSTVLQLTVTYLLKYRPFKWIRCTHVWLRDYTLPSI